MLGCGGRSDAGVAYAAACSALPVPGPHFKFALIEVSCGIKRASTFRVRDRVAHVTLVSTRKVDRSAVAVPVAGTHRLLVLLLRHSAPIYHR